MRVIAISDLHGYLPNLGSVEADLLLIAGDLVPDQWNPQFKDGVTFKQQAHWLRGEFAEWVEAQPYEHVIMIAGNHDVLIEQNPKLMKQVPGIYLQDETVEIDGYKIHGSPWAPQFGNWAFMKKDANLVEEWDKIPHDVDILMTHGPVWGKADFANDYAYDPKTGEMVAVGQIHVGSSTLAHKLEYGEYPNLKLVVFGHIHPAYGKVEENGVTYANVTYVNNHYQPTNKPMFFELTK